MVAYGDVGNYGSFGSGSGGGSVALDLVAVGVLRGRNVVVELRFKFQR